METTLAHLLDKSGNRTELARAFALLWLATADGHLAPQTWRCLDRQFDSLPRARKHADALLALIAAGENENFLTACAVLRRELDGPRRTIFLEHSVAVATAAGDPGIAANHLLRLYTDLLNFDFSDFLQLFRKQSGRDLPEPGDPGSPAWWRKQDDGADGRDLAGLYATREQALQALGLEKEASRRDIKRAYRRLAQVYHPDRHQALEATAREAAELNFLRVREAYEVLRQ